jgi:putative ABC transport system ATP-binding protein
MSHDTTAVLCEGITKDFGTGEDRVKALQGIDVNINAGEMTLLVGPSGCGKTTLISIVAGLLDPTAGDVWVMGTDLQKLSRSKIVRFRRDNIGFVFQQYNLLPALTAAENAAVPLLIAGHNRHKAVGKAKEILDMLAMSDKVNVLPANLSGGQQQRVAIARALVHEPRLLVCDEPTAALDGRSGRTVMQLLRQMAVQPGRAVIVVTHDSRVYGFGDRMLSMEDGRIVQDKRQLVTEATMHGAASAEQMKAVAEAAVAAS